MLTKIKHLNLRFVVETENGIAPLQKSMAGSWKVKYSLNLCHRNIILGYLPKGYKNSILHTNFTQM